MNSPTKRALKLLQLDRLIVKESTINEQPNQKGTETSEQGTPFRLYRSINEQPNQKGTETLSAAKDLPSLILPSMNSPPKGH